MPRRVSPIIGLEPSCILSFDDEYHRLLPGDPRVPLVAERAILFDDFMASLDAQHLPDMSGYDEVLLHTVTAIKRQPSARVVPTALWGISKDARSTRWIQDAVVWPARSDSKQSTMTSPCKSESSVFFRPSGITPRHATIVAPGVSCRQQIAEGTGRKALHSGRINVPGHGARRTG